MVLDIDIMVILLLLCIYIDKQKCQRTRAEFTFYICLLITQVNIIVGASILYYIYRVMMYYIT